MEFLSHQEVVTMFLALAVLLGAARFFGEIAKRLHQPAVIGEILAGIFLGPTVLGYVLPDVGVVLFPTEGPNALVLNGLTTLCVVLFLLVAGLEVDLSTVFRLRHSVMIIGLCGVSVLFITGFSFGHFIPELLGMEPGTNRLVFALFFGTALAICALPVIAKTLMDLNLLRSDLGVVIIAVAIFRDVIGWLIFAVVLGLMRSGPAAAGVSGIGATITMTLLFAGTMLTAGRWIVDRLLPWVQAHSSWPAGVLGFAMVLGLLSAAFTEWIGIHAIFGAFIAGVVLGDSAHMQQHTRATMSHFIASVFAPLFFASIGLRINFVANFDGMLILTVLLIACVGETLASSFGARLTGFPRRQAWAIGFALNARGAMEIVLALLAMQYGVIGERLFVALIVMALVTSIIAGPLMQRVLRRKKASRFRDFLTIRGFLPQLRAGTCREAIDELAEAVAPDTGLNPDLIAETVWQREQTMSTALPHGLAVPHARLAGLNRPIVAVGLSRDGVAFDAEDAVPTQLIFLILTPMDDNEVQLEILADIARTFQKADTISRAQQAATFTQFQALVNIESAQG